MAESIQSRSTHQCRSHHQKVLKKYCSIQNFIKMFEEKTQKRKIAQDFHFNRNLVNNIGPSTFEDNIIKSFNNIKNLSEANALYPFLSAQ